MNPLENGQYYAIRIDHPVAEFYLTALPAVLLLDVAYSEAFSDLHGSYVGVERRLDLKRVAEISRYLETRDAVIPNTIILAANCPKGSQSVDIDDKEVWRAVEVNDKDNLYVLTIPNRKDFAAIVDGQHRLNGFKMVSSDVKNRLLPCAVFMGLKHPQQATIFATINYNQKPVNKSITYSLFGCSTDKEDPIEWTPEKMAVHTMRCLNARNDSPFQDHIKAIAEDGKLVASTLRGIPNKRWLVSTATIVEGILSLITHDAKEDRDRMFSRKVFRTSRQDVEYYENESVPLRGFFMSGKSDEFIYSIIRNYFQAVKDLFWSDDAVSIFQKTAGLQALFGVLRRILSYQLTKQKDVSYKAFHGLLGNVDMKIFESDRFKDSSGKSRSYIQHAILVGIDRKYLDEIKSDEIQQTLRTLYGIEQEEMTHA